MRYTSSVCKPGGHVGKKQNCREDSSCSAKTYWYRIEGWVTTARQGLCRPTRWWHDVFQVPRHQSSWQQQERKKQIIDSSRTKSKKGPSASKNIKAAHAEHANGKGKQIKSADTNMSILLPRQNCGACVAFTLSHNGLHLESCGLGTVSVQLWAVERILREETYQSRRK